MEEQILKLLLKSFEMRKEAVFFLQKEDLSLIIANGAARSSFGDENGVIDFREIFGEEQTCPFLQSSVLDTLPKNEITTFSHVMVFTQKGEKVSADVVVGYADFEKKQLFVEISFKKDERMEIALSHMNQSSKPECIFNFDEDLSLMHCNSAFTAVFGENMLSLSAYLQTLPNDFAVFEKDTLLGEIRQNLKEATSFTKKIKLSTENNGEKCYSLEFHKKTLDYAQTEKILASLTCIEEEMELQEQLDDINQYFKILQSLCNGLLYRFDIHSRTLYRDEEMAKLYHLPTVAKNFPTIEWLESVMHAEDIPDYIAYIDKVVDGVDGSHTARIKTPEGVLEYHHFTFKAVRRQDGSIKEMVGHAANVHHIKEIEKELGNINQYFRLIQMQTECLLFRYDRVNRILYRNSDIAKELGLCPYVENYPNEEQINRTVHVDDRAEYMEFFNRVIAGEEGTFRARLFTVEETFEHHVINARAVLNPDGSIHEMLIILLNDHNLREAENELSDVNRLFDAFQELSEDLLFRIDLKQKTISQGRTNLGNVERNPEEIPFPQGIYESDTLFPQHKAIYEQFVATALKGESGCVELKMRELGKETYTFCRLTWIPVKSDSGEITEIIGKQVNVQAVKELEEQANYDSLTHILNKRAIAEATSQLLSRGLHGERHALLFIDLDDFKYVNDNLGHAFGDFLLHELAKRIKKSIRYQDMVGRVGGDEFVVLLKDIPAMDILLGKAKLLLSAISEDVVDGAIRHSMKASVGIAVFPDHGTSYEELYHRADLALYQSKEKGKNAVVLYES